MPGKHLMFFLFLSATTVTGHAASPWETYGGRPTPWDKSADDPWKADIELGFVKTGGNTELETLNMKGQIMNIREDWRHTARFEAVRSSDGGTTTGERYLLSSKSDLNINEYTYGFGLFSYQRDLFSGYIYEVTEIFGYGRRLIARDDLALNAEAGAGARQSRLNNEDFDPENEGILHLAANLDWSISENASLTQDFATDIGNIKTISKSITALKTNINSKLSSKISYQIKHTSNVPPDIEATDSEMGVTLVYLIF